MSNSTIDKWIQVTITPELMEQNNKILVRTEMMVNGRLKVVKYQAV